MTTYDELWLIDNSKDWYFVGGYDEQAHTTRNTVVFAKNAKEARAKIKPWKDKNNLDPVHYYRNNYKPDARALINKGSFIR